MSKKWKIGLAVSSVVAALLIGGAAITGSALAQEEDPPVGEETPRLPGAMGSRHGGRGGRRGGPGSADDIATALGLTIEELEAAREEGKSLTDLALEQGVEIADIQAAMEAARQARIAQGVADGRLTQEEADELLANMPPAEEGRLPEVLGIDRETFRQAMDEARGQILEQAIADGVITEAQAEAMNNHAGPGHPRGRGGFGGRGGGRGGFGGRGEHRPGASCPAPPTAGE